ncbi:hypothetical protein B0H19DRAFT_691759 [Mycena capillaripes]|nr:hypothetical protein B0H19DRAFT_691759 [Mycena capillaripes]
MNEGGGKGSDGIGHAGAFSQFPVIPSQLLLWSRIGYIRVGTVRSGCGVCARGWKRETECIDQHGRHRARIPRAELCSWSCVTMHRTRDHYRRRTGEHTLRAGRSGGQRRAERLGMQSHSLRVSPSRTVSRCVSDMGRPSCAQENGRWGRMGSRCQRQMCSRDARVYEEELMQTNGELRPPGSGGGRPSKRPRHKGPHGCAILRGCVDCRENSDVWSRAAPGVVSGDAS